MPRICRTNPSTPSRPRFLRTSPSASCFEPGCAFGFLGALASRLSRFACPFPDHGNSALNESHANARARAPGHVASADDVVAVDDHRDRIRNRLGVGDEHAGARPRDVEKRAVDHGTRAIELAGPENQLPRMSSLLCRAHAGLQPYARPCPFTAENFPYRFASRSL